MAWAALEGWVSMTPAKITFKVVFKMIFGKHQNQISYLRYIRIFEYWYKCRLQMNEPRWYLQRVKYGSFNHGVLEEDTIWGACFYTYLILIHSKGIKHRVILHEKYIFNLKFKNIRFLYYFNFTVSSVCNRIARLATNISINAHRHIKSIYPKHKM